VEYAGWIDVSAEPPKTSRHEFTSKAMVPDRTLFSNDPSKRSACWISSTDPNLLRSMHITVSLPPILTIPMKMISSKMK
jgi:hypothetical protein